MRKITIITGASSGMGAEFTRQLAVKYTKTNSENREFWLLARSEEKLNEIKTEIQKLDESCSFFSVKAIAMDLSGSEGINKFKDLLLREEASGKILIEMLINNAGFGTYGPFEDTPLEKELSMVNLNCASLTGMCGLCLPFMNRGSSIINVASLASFMPLGNFAVYGATKAYVLSFTVALAAEVKHRGIKVSALCPGSVSTNFANVASNGARKEVLHGKDPVKVVKHCLKNAEKGKIQILWALKWKVTAFLSRFAGRYLVAWFTYKFNKRPYQH